MRFVHAADLHLDSPLRGLARHPGAPVEEIRGATRRAMENLVDLCLEEEVDFLLLAGDLYDGDWPDYSTGLFFASQMARLREAGITVYSIRGNHDAASRLTRSLSLPDNVRELSTREPETLLDERLGLAVHGQGFAARSVTEDLAARYPDALSGYFNVGLLHTCLDGREGHDPYAPCTPTTLANKGYDYWALGHVHAREVVSEDPWIVFPGNLQGRHARETGPKGASLVEAPDGRVASVSHRVLDVVRWEALEVDVSDGASPEDAVDAVRDALESAAADAEGRLLAARVTLVGETPAHEALTADLERWESQLRAAVIDLGAPVWVEKVRFRTQGALDLEELRGRDDAVGQLARALAALRGDDEGLGDLAGELEVLRRKLPKAAREGADGLRLDDPTAIADALEDVERLLLPRLLGAGLPGGADDGGRP